MIGRLRGILIEKQPPTLLVDVAGVAYEVFASMQTFYQLSPVGSEITLHTHFVVREDAQQLYGFHAQSERALFRELLKVNGVGPKLALTILSSISPDDFIQCIHSQNAGALVKLPGVGKKTAERLIIEMRDRLQSSDTIISINNTVMAKTSHEQDAISALISLGYKPVEASKAIQNVYADHLVSEDLIRLALKRMAE